MGPLEMGWMTICKNGPAISLGVDSGQRFPGEW